MLLLSAIDAEVWELAHNLHSQRDNIADVSGHAIALASLPALDELQLQLVEQKQRVALRRKLLRGRVVGDFFESSATDAAARPEPRGLAQQPS